MKWDNFTAGRVEAFRCRPGKLQTIYWDGKTRGLGVRVTASGAKSYIFETSLNGKTLRITIGNVATYTVADAQRQADEYKALTNRGIDPRQLKARRVADEKAAEESNLAEIAKRAATEQSESITLSIVWQEYVEERKGLWSDSSNRDHRTVIQAGGETRSRSPKLTEPGPLASLATVRLVDLTSEKIEVWARAEVISRPSYARLSLRLLKACLNWCATHSTYSKLLNGNPATSTKARESLGKEKKKHDLLQREQLGAWFSAVRQIRNPVIAAYLQCLLLTGSRREEMASLLWTDVDFQWQSIKLNDKVEDFRMVPLTPYVSHLISALPRRNQWVFSSPAAKSGRLVEPRIAHKEALVSAGLPDMTLHGLRRSFATLCEWTETPSGIAAQIQGHAPQGVREQNYIRRPLDLLRMWHVKIESWILTQAGIDFVAATPGLRVVAGGVA